MFVVVWSWGSNVVVLGELLETCDVCGSEEDHQVFLFYEHKGVYYVFHFVSKRVYTLVCKHCLTQSEGIAAYLEKQFRRPPIPYMHRFGCLLFIGIVIGVSIFLYLLANRIIFR